MVRAVISFVAFLVPIVICFAAISAVFILAREGVSVADVISRQYADRGALYQLAYNATDRAYKHAAVVIREPDILIIGTSRAMQFRSESFKEPERVYNAGGMTSLGDVEWLIRDAASSSLVVFVIDPAYLRQSVAVSPLQSSSTRELAKDFARNGWRNAVRDYVLGKFTVQQLWRSRATSSSIGLVALVRGSGFRYDGSYEYGYMVEATDRRAVLSESIAADIHDGIGSDLSGPLRTESLASINTILTQAQKRHMHIVGVMPPYASELFDQVHADHNEAVRVLTEVFASYGFQLHDMTDYRTYGSSDAELVDSGHGGEKMYARMLVELAESEPELQSQLQSDIARRIRDSKHDIRIY